MRFIPTRIHGILDYLMAVVLIAIPLMFRLRIGPAAGAFLALGAGTLIYSLLTRYETGLLGVIPMPVHLGLDTAFGLFLLASPWLFGFAGRIWVPHVLFGVVEVGGALMTRTVPERTPGDLFGSRHGL